jgi:hypothetical protein
MSFLKSFAVTVATSLATLVLAIAGQTAKAAPINWGTAQGITGTADVVTTGTLFASANFAGSNTTVNGVTFDAFPITGGGTSATVGNISVLGIVGTGTGFNPTTLTTTNINTWASLPTSYKDLLAPTLRLVGIGNSLQFTLSNLTNGATYSIQYWVNDSRWSNPQGMSVNVGSAVLSPNTGSTTGGVGQWVTGTFTAVGTTQTFSASPATLNTTYANAMQVRVLAVPEPSTWAIAGVGLACAVIGREVRRRRRNQQRFSAAD